MIWMVAALGSLVDFWLTLFGEPSVSETNPLIAIRYWSLL